MKTRPLICDECDGLIDGEAAHKYRVSQCPACGSEEIRDAEYEDIYRLYRESCAATAAAIRERNAAQMTAGAFQTEALLLRSELDSLKRRVA